MWFGTESQFAICVKGRFDSDPPETREVDVYAADRWLTCDDNSVYVPHFAGMLEQELGRILTDGNLGGKPRPYPDLSVVENYERLWADAKAGDNSEYLRHRFMAWGPTADNVGALIFREGETAYIPFMFHREDHHDPGELGKVFVAELPVWELASVLHQAAWALMWDWAGYWASRSR